MYGKRRNYGTSAGQIEGHGRENESLPRGDDGKDVGLV
jgi:hypothetical protein